MAIYAFLKTPIWSITNESSLTKINMPAIVQYAITLETINFLYKISNVKFY